ncbi:hypothetical protein KL909_001888 [Ogataea angusta]|nr:hypothetical protein KL909_001888 [Ogataea angusta]
MCKIPNLSKGCYCYPIEPGRGTSVHQQKKKSDLKFHLESTTDVLEVSGNCGLRAARNVERSRSHRYVGQLQSQTEAAGVHAQAVGVDYCLDSASRRPRRLLLKLFHLSDHY